MGIDTGRQAATLPVLFYPPRRQTHGLHALPACVDAWVHAWLDSASTLAGCALDLPAMPLIACEACPLVRQPPTDHCSDPARSLQPIHPRPLSFLLPNSITRFAPASKRLSNNGTALIHPIYIISIYYTGSNASLSPTLLRSRRRPSA